MEAPGFLTLLYTLRTLPSQALSSSSSLTPSSVDIDIDLPWQNKVLAALFVLHYTYRALLFPFLQPSMSPLHILIWASAICFQVINGLCLGSWLSGYGPTTAAEWAVNSPTWQFVAGIGLFYVGLAANYYHDDELREIRRRQARKQAKDVKDGKVAKGGSVEKHYEIPQAGLFKVVLYPHYFVEWVEWFGFWMAAGWGCVPARCFLLNEVAAMLPRAVKGRQWYAEKFGEERIKGRWAVIPGVI
jgi:3-oxo-5-alpha-steroid 4-dehydrogenase 1